MAAAGRRAAAPGRVGSVGYLLYLHRCNTSPAGDTIIQNKCEYSPAQPTKGQGGLDCSLSVCTIYPLPDRVQLSPKAKRQLRKLPRPIVASLNQWQRAVEADGLAEVRRVPGYHDEPLGGTRVGQRSIRLNRAYRAFYTIQDGQVRLLTVVDVNHHNY